MKATVQVPVGLREWNDSITSYIRLIMLDNNI